MCTRFNRQEYISVLLTPESLVSTYPVLSDEGLSTGIVVRAVSVFDSAVEGPGIPLPAPPPGSVGELSVTHGHTVGPVAFVDVAVGPSLHEKVRRKL